MVQKTPWEVVLYIACFLYYGGKWEYAYVIRYINHGRGYFYAFLMLIIATTVLQSVYITQVESNWTLYLILVYGAMAPSLDFAFHDFPGTGAFCLWASQFAFVLWVSKHNPAAYTSPYCAVGMFLWIVTFLHIADAWRYYRHGVKYAQSL